MATLAPDPQEFASLEVRRQYLQRRRRAQPRRAVAVAATVVAIVWIAMVGLGLFLH
jgi:hypothetical protein